MQMHANTNTQESELVGLLNLFLSRTRASAVHMSGWVDLFLHTLTSGMCGVVGWVYKVGVMSSVCMLLGVYCCM